MNLIPFFQQHPYIDAACIYMAFAVVGTMPPKGVKWTSETVYDWIYDFAHVLINFVPSSRRPNFEPPQAAAPAQPKE